MRQQRVKPEHWLKWIELASAQRLFILEAGWMGDWLSQMRGEHLLYAGVDPAPKYLKQAHVNHCSTLQLPWQRGASHADAMVSDHRWPLPDNSIDFVVLQHSIDMSNRPHQSLREAARIVVCGGYIIMITFNPRSLWGGYRWLRTLSSELPYMCNPVATGRIHDWLTLLDFNIEYQGQAGHIWPLSLGNEITAKRVDRVLAGTPYFPGAVQLVIARKNHAGLTRVQNLRKSEIIPVNYPLPVTKF